MQNNGLRLVTKPKKPLVYILVGSRDYNTAAVIVTISF